DSLPMRVEQTSPVTGVHLAWVGENKVDCVLDAGTAPVTPRPGLSVEEEIAARCGELASVEPEGYCVDVPTRGRVCEGFGRPKAVAVCRDSSRDRPSVPARHWNVFFGPNSGGTFNGVTMSKDF